MRGTRRRRYSSRVSRDRSMNSAWMDGGRGGGRGGGEGEAAAERDGSSAAMSSGLATSGDEVASPRHGAALEETGTRGRHLTVSCSRGGLEMAGDPLLFPLLPSLVATPLLSTPLPLLPPAHFTPLFHPHALTTVSTSSSPSHPLTLSPLLVRPHESGRRPAGGACALLCHSFSSAFHCAALLFFPSCLRPSLTALRCGHHRVHPLLSPPPLLPRRSSVSPDGAHHPARSGGFSAAAGGRSGDEEAADHRYLQRLHGRLPLSLRPLSVGASALLLPSPPAVLPARPAVRPGLLPPGKALQARGGGRYFRRRLPELRSHRRCTGGLTVFRRLPRPPPFDSGCSPTAAVLHPTLLLLLALHDRRAQRLREGAGPGPQQVGDCVLVQGEGAGAHTRVLRGRAGRGAEAGAEGHRTHPPAVGGGQTGGATNRCGFQRSGERWRERRGRRRRGEGRGTVGRRGGRGGPGRRTVETEGWTGRRRGETRRERWGGWVVFTRWGRRWRFVGQRVPGSRRWRRRMGHRRRRLKHRNSFASAVLYRTTSPPADTAAPPPPHASSRAFHLLPSHCISFPRSSPLCERCARTAAAPRRALTSAVSASVERR